MTRAHFARSARPGQADRSCWEPRASGGGTAPTRAPRNARRIESLQDRRLRAQRAISLAPLQFHLEDGRDPNSVLAVAPLVERSGLTDLLEAMRIFSTRRPDGVRLTIVGEGELEPALRATIASLDWRDRVAVLGRVTRSRLLSLMRVHALMALPYRSASPGDDDGVPAVLLEAMAVGLPVIATAVMGFPRVLEDGWTGRLISPNDPVWLAGALETMLERSHVRVRMAKAAREKIEREFGLSRKVWHLARVFADAAAETDGHEGDAVAARSIVSSASRSS